MTNMKPTLVLLQVSTSIRGEELSSYPVKEG